MPTHGGQTTTAGLIVNPVSARDIRRVVANASGLQVADRTNIVLRALSALGAMGVKRVLAMPDKKGVTALLERSLAREHNLGRNLPVVDYCDMPVTSTVSDTHTAARMMAEQGVGAIIVLGGDGTHRAVVAACGPVPIAGLSTGTNNAYPEMRESTITGLAVGLYVTGAVPDSVALRDNKLLRVSVNNGAVNDLALVDVVASTDRYVGARALWKTDSFIELYVTFADPEMIGMSAIAAAVEPVSRAHQWGLRVGLDPMALQAVTAPIGPGMVEAIGITGFSRLEPDMAAAVDPRAGTLALDGERELELNPADQATITLETNGFRSIDVGRIMHWAARTGPTSVPRADPTSAPDHQGLGPAQPHGNPCKQNRPFGHPQVPGSDRRTL